MFCKSAVSPRKLHQLPSAWASGRRPITTVGPRQYLKASVGLPESELCVIDVSARDWTDDGVAILTHLGRVAMREVRLPLRGESVASEHVSPAQGRPLSAA